MLIQHKQQGSKGIFYIEENDVTLAEMTYSMAADDVMIIDHTEVSDTLRGKMWGISCCTRRWNMQNQTYQNLSVMPFAKSVFDKKKDEFGDVLRGN